MPPRSLLAQFGEPIARRYRLINASFEAHPHLDSIYDSLDEALSDATAWISKQASRVDQVIGVEVSTRSGEWRMLRHPTPLGT